MAKKNINIMVFLTMIVALLSAAQPAYASVTITDLGTLPGGSQSYANGINDAGGIVGYSRLASGYNHAFLWQNGVMTDLGTRFSTEGSGSYANYINDIGAITGYDDTTGQPTAILWQNGVMADFGAPLGTSYRSWATAINISGNVVGYFQYIYAPTCSDCYSDGNYHAILWTQQGEVTYLGSLGGSESYANGINNIGQVVGWSQTASGYNHAFLWQNGVMTDLGTLPGGSESYANGINNIGQVVGLSTNAAGYRHATLWNASTGAIIDLGTLPDAICSTPPDGIGSGDCSYAYGINDFGQIVGYSYNAAGVMNATLWNASTSAIADLGTLPDGDYSVASGINNLGQVVGWSATVSGCCNATLWTVSIPSTTPVQQIQQITTTVQDLVTSGVLNQGQSNALIAKLDVVTQKINTGNTKAVINELQAFINQVQAYINAGILTVEQGQPLNDATDDLINQLK